MPRTGVIYVTTEAAKLGFPPAIPTGATSARGSPRPAPLPGAPRARARASPSTSTIRSTRRSPASGSCARPSPALYNRLYRRGMPSQYSAENVARLRRRARGAHPRGGQPRPRQPRPLPARLHRVRGAARHLQGLHRRSRSCSRASAATRSPPTICAARSTAAGCRRCCCRTRATRPAS